MKKIASPLLEELEAKSKALHEQILDVDRQITAEKLRITKETHRVEIGSIVRSGNGKEYRVSKIDPYEYGPSIYGNPRKKDGGFSKAEHYIYGNWTVVTPETTT